MDILKENDKCWCGSEKIHKSCHKGKKEDGDGQRLLYERTCYADSWCDTAEHFRQNHCYDWMASKLIKYAPKKIFDIGCGEGSGLIALMATCNKYLNSIISIDENYLSIELAKRHLGLYDISAESHKRINIEIKNDHHFFTHKPIDLKNKKGIVLLESDLVSDLELEMTLKTHGEFDAVTIWLIGTYPDRKNNREISSLITKNYEEFPGEYRLCVQNRADELADKILKIEGIFQVVDRSAIFSAHPSLREDCIRSHREQASVTNLEFVELDEKIYTEPEQGIQMIQTKGTSGVNVDVSRLSMKSIIFKKKY